MSVYVVNLVIDQGADFQQTFDLTAANSEPLDLTGWAAAAQMRKHSGSKTFYVFSVEFTDREAGQIKITLSDVATRAIKPGRYIYDLILTDTNLEKVKMLEGQALVRGSATRE